MSFDIKNIVDLNALTMGLTGAANKIGLLLPMTAINYAHTTALQMIPLTGEIGRMATTSLSAFFDIWRMQMIIHS